MGKFDALKTVGINLSRQQNMAKYDLDDSFVYQKWHWPSSWKIKRHFYSDINTIWSRNSINNMDYMRISGTEPSSVIHSQTK